MRLFQSGGGDLKETSLKITSKDIERGSAAFEKKEGRDSMYRVASFLLQQPDYWGNASRVADALAVLLLTWNAAFLSLQWGPIRL